MESKICYACKTGKFIHSKEIQYLKFFKLYLKNQFLPNWSIFDQFRPVFQCLCFQTHSFISVLLYFYDLFVFDLIIKSIDKKNLAPLVLWICGLWWSMFTKTCWQWYQISIFLQFQNQSWSIWSNSLKSILIENRLENIGRYLSEKSIFTRLIFDQFL